MLSSLNINKNWSLFLDRDGVINEEKYMDYVYAYDEFIFYEGVKDALKIFNGLFGPIVMVTNQRGVGKGLMTENDLLDIHTQMQRDIDLAGGRIDKIYYCTSLDNTHPDRKPNPGMALKAQKENPRIQFADALMVGNNLSDMEFGKRSGMHTALINTTSPAVKLPHSLVDYQFPSLIALAHWLQGLPG